MVHISYNDHDPMMGGAMITDKHVLTLDDDKLRAVNVDDIKVVYRTQKVDPSNPKSIPSGTHYEGQSSCFAKRYLSR